MVVSDVVCSVGGTTTAAAASVDAGDALTFTGTVEASGGADAFDVTVGPFSSAGFASVESFSVVVLSGASAFWALAVSSADGKTCVLHRW